MNREIRTLQTHPDHPYLGFVFKGPDGQMYLCDSHEIGQGLWLTNILSPAARKNISERGIGSSYHLQFDQVRKHEVQYHRSYWVVDAEVPMNRVAVVPGPLARILSDRYVLFPDEACALGFSNRLRKALASLQG